MSPPLLRMTALASVAISVQLPMKRVRIDDVVNPPVRSVLAISCLMESVSESVGETVWDGREVKIESSLVSMLSWSCCVVVESFMAHNGSGGGR